MSTPATITVNVETRGFWKLALAGYIAGVFVAIGALTVVSGWVWWMS